MASKFNFAKSALGKSSKLKKTAMAGGLMAAVGYGAAQGDPIQHTMNATQEAIFDTDQVDNMILGTDLRARDFFPGFMGMTSVQGLIQPKENVAGGPFSKRRFNKTPFSYSQVKQEQVDKINQSAAEYPFDTVGGDNQQRGYSQNPGSSFPQRMTNRSWDSATGDIVLGSYNLRRG